MARQYKDAPAKLTGVQKNLSGSVIGGYENGIGFGTRQTPQASNRPSVGAGGAAEPQPNTAVPTMNRTAPASGQTLIERQRLFKDMESAGSDNISQDMRERARKLGVSDAGFNQAASRIKENSAYSPASGTAPTQSGNTAGQQSAPEKKKSNRQYKQSPVSTDPKREEMRKKGINPLTGLPMGAMPGDESYIKTDAAKQDMKTAGIDPATGQKALTPEEQQAAMVKTQMREANNRKILDDYYAKTGKPNPREVMDQPVTRPSAPQAGRVAPAPVAPPVMPTPGVAVPAAPASPVATVSTPRMDLGGDYGGKTSWRTLPQGKDLAKENVAKAKTQGKIPSYQDRMQAGTVSGEEMVKAVTGAVKTIGDKTKKGVATARSFRDRTNAWADSIRG